MPAILFRFLPHIAIVLAVLAGVWYIDNRGYDRAIADRDARDAKARAQWDARIEALSIKLGTDIADIDLTATRTIERIGTIEKTIVQPTIQREIILEKRLSDPAAGITDGLCQAINAARAESHDPANSVSIDCVALPAPAPFTKPDNSQSGQ